MELDSNLKSSNVKFPNWKELINAFTFELKSEDMNSQTFRKKLEFFLSNANLITDDMATKSVSLAMQMMISKSGEYLPGESIDSILEKLKSSTFNSNEFYTIYNITESRYSQVDDTVETKLGINKDEFTLTNLLALTPGEIVVYEEDLPHFIRWAGIAFLLFSLPGFTFKSNSDYFTIKFRVRLNKNGKLVSLEKKCYLSNECISTKDFIPNFHFDKWTILPAESGNIVKPLFVSDFEQSDAMNSLSYLFNAALLNFPIKYLLILDERITNDRNKGVAVSMNDNIERFSTLKGNFTENQIGDYLAKTIRPKISQLSSVWTNRNINIDNDNLAVIEAKSLGLLPIPQNIKDLMYARVE